MPQRIATQIHNKLLKTTHVLLIPHKDPDADAIGAVSALTSYLTSHNIRVDIFCATPVPSSLMFIEHAKNITSDTILWKHTYDAIIVCDTGSPSHAGMSTHLKEKKSTLWINIDHHDDNTNYGTINHVVPDRSSTCEILYEYCISNKINITHEMATALLAGIIFDTGCFSNSATSQANLKIAGKLIQQGASMMRIMSNMIQDKNMPTLKLWGMALSRLIHDTELDVVYTTITQHDISTHGADEESTYGISNLMNTLEQGMIRCVFREKSDGTIKVSMRSPQGEVDVSAIARELGGGGHPRAAGCALDTTIDNAYATLKPILKKYINQV